MARTTAGVTLGTGEGGNAFGDRFFIRGFDARNDVFIDGVRDPGVSVRENFFTEQIEILQRSGFVLRRPRHHRRRTEHRHQAGGRTKISTISTRHSAPMRRKRVTLDVNQVISPTLAVRFDGMCQNANIAGRNDTTDDRDGGLAATKWKPNDSFTVTANYVHTYLWPAGFRRSL